MKIKFYGTRSSAPVCDAGFQEFGGNTTCVRLASPDMQTIAILDAGTGIRNLGKDLLALGQGRTIRNLREIFEVQLQAQYFPVQLDHMHHDPDHDDVFLRRMEQLCQERFQHCVLAREGMEIEL